MFTVDKLIGTVVKQVCPIVNMTCCRLSDMSEQVQTILSDSRSQDIFDLFRKKRYLATPSTQDLINARKNTERVLGPDENLFRMVWVRYDFDSCLLCCSSTIVTGVEERPDAAGLVGDVGGVGVGGLSRETVVAVLVQPFGVDGECQTETRSLDAKSQMRMIIVRHLTFNFNFFSIARFGSDVGSFVVSILFSDQCFPDLVLDSSELSMSRTSVAAPGACKSPQFKLDKMAVFSAGTFFQLGTFLSNTSSTIDFHVVGRKTRF